jgi:ABC-type sugar transport system permease subunit
MKESKRKETLFIFCMIILPFIQWIVFWLFVNMQTIILAFQDQRTEAFTLHNFTAFWESLTQGGDISIAVKNTFVYFSVNLIIVMPMALLISYFLYKCIMGYKAFRIIFYLPAIISGVAYTTAFTEFVHPNGPLGEIIRIFGGEPNPITMLSRRETATTAMLIYCVLTGCTGNMLIFGGAMVRIPEEVLEAAKLDGCGPIRELVSLIFPLIWPTFSTQLIFTLTGFFNQTGPILLFTNGNYDTTTISFWIFKQVYGEGGLGGTGKYNVVSCAGFCFTVLWVPIVLMLRRLVEKIDTVEY